MLATGTVHKAQHETSLSHRQPTTTSLRLLELTPQSTARRGNDQAPTPSAGIEAPKARAATRACAIHAAQAYRDRQLAGEDKRIGSFCLAAFECIGGTDMRACC